MVQSDKKKNKKQGCLIGFISFLMILIIISLVASKDESIPDKNSERSIEKEWKDMTYEEHELWINNYMDDTDDNGYALIGHTIDGIKQRIQYPKTVSFDINPSFNKNFRNIVEADSGLVFFYGKGTAKNGFGVPIEFSYSVKWKITPDELKILDITVN